MMQTTGKGKRVEVEGGQIIRSLGRKVRHGKVYTSKGPRDRRFRLSSDTAMMFYDVQDKLGYDRPSKAIDWLMKEAKSAIDALETSEPTPGEHSKQHTLIDHNQINSFNDYENPIEEVCPMDFTWNSSYDSGDGFAFVDREPLQSSYHPTIIHTFDNDFVGDETFSGFDFQQESKLEEDEICNLVSKHCRSSGNSILRYEGTSFNYLLNYLKCTY